MALNWKRVATEGATTDGREITRQQIEQMAGTYDPKAKLGARVFCEHIRGMAPDSPFRAYGDVRALKAEAVEGGKLGLFAQIDPTDELKAMTKNRQKIYSSVEIDPNFGGSGQAYMVGLGVTDSPASFGTDVLTFAQQHPDHFRARKQRPENLFAAGFEMDADFGEADKPVGAADPVTSFFSALCAKLGISAAPAGAGAATPATPPALPGAAPASGLSAQAFTAEQIFSAMRTVQGEAEGGAHDKAVQDQIAGLQQQFADFRRTLESSQFGAQRPPVTGSASGDLTDC